MASVVLVGCGRFKTIGSAEAKGNEGKYRTVLVLRTRLRHDGAVGGELGAY